MSFGFERHHNTQQMGISPWQRLETKNENNDHAQRSKAWEALAPGGRLSRGEQEGDESVPGETWPWIRSPWTLECSFSHSRCWPSHHGLANAGPQPMQTSNIASKRHAFHLFIKSLWWYNSKYKEVIYKENKKLVYKENNSLINRLTISQRFLPTFSATRQKWKWTILWQISTTDSLSTVEPLRGKKLSKFWI